MLEKLTDWTLTLSLVAAMTLLGNFIGYEVMPLTALPGIISLMVIVLVGMVIHELLPFKLPAIAYIGILAFIVTIPGVPGSEKIAEWTAEVNLLALTTPILAYAGVSIGNSWADFAKMGWKTIIIGMLVLIGTYLGSAIIAEIILRIQGIV
ncbi:hypothetical protein JEOAER750_00673 [Jeotgalicoccus aerolatus]|jgi:hypothetical protein|uniref:DUF340 domain-containing protein n=1 Tax=Jeotgalicoccus aerolatus TaxID=709510 RepID=A0A1G9AGB8_9STAP|nr:hypothetical protein [Jeotgalicoccus aerolatus]MBP1952988.1 hypothetical protein [Jeotgalicoccus aerolatus]NMA81490.1 hypothetical protein [Jeotgalicoccus aerolatus]CAD2073138.1 hypothetical protein JEOAER750_00673 [Jeotgalicoccus aerolatus]SDK26399.1 hypothetical protein SAMN05216187_106126 [Jeotgalicoccus aerolatus]GGE01638.1 hypothetical protein GCM10007273_12640 [Jeotgalicoccus aerolatus]